MYHDDFGCKRDTQVRGGLRTAKNAGSNIKIGVQLRCHCPLSKTALQRQGLGRLRVIYISTHNTQLEVPVRGLQSASILLTNMPVQGAFGGIKFVIYPVIRPTSTFSPVHGAYRCELRLHSHVFMCM
jgi:hypothetical protein